MKDTPSDVEVAYTKMFARFSGPDRLRMVSDMFDTARAVVIANLRARHPDLTPAELRAGLFERLYAGDVEPAVLEWVVKSL